MVKRIAIIFCCSCFCVCRQKMSSCDRMTFDVDPSVWVRVHAIFYRENIICVQDADFKIVFTKSTPLTILYSSRRDRNSHSYSHRP